MTTMTESLLYKWFAAGDAGELDAFEEYLHAGVVVHAPLGFSTEGIEAEKAAWRSALAGVPDLRHDIKEVISGGSTMAARAVVTGTHRGPFVGLPATGRRFEIDQAVFAHIRDGKAAEVWEIADSAALLQQLGALPE
jgi:steroid delta-isomerase-like uncharacterized protein